MRFDVVTLFPECFASFLRAGLLGKAIDDGLIEVRFQDPRDHTHDKHRSVDDAPYGGGSGMVMRVGPIAGALAAVAPLEGGGRPRRVLLTPQGRPFRQADAQRLAALPAVTLVCGRYEGVDERVRALVDEEVSLGDFVLLGGEVAAMAVLEATARLRPGVLGNAQSSADESHVAGLLEYPQYTRPADFEGEAVPAVLLGGNHAAIARWRRKQALRRTRDRRPDLLAMAALDAADRALLDEPEDEP